VSYHLRWQQRFPEVDAADQALRVAAGGLEEFIIPERVDTGLAKLERQVELECLGLVWFQLSW
jgi:hypothetical protein